MGRGMSRILKILLSVAAILLILQFFNSKWNLVKTQVLQNTAESESASRQHSSKTTWKSLFWGEPVTQKGTEKFDLQIIVLTYNRPFSLIRLLKSLNEAEYFKDKVRLDVWIDRSKKDQTIHEGTYGTATEFKFEHGFYQVHNHTKHVGIYGQWLGTWNPAPTSEEIAVILEDDLEVSKYFYKWLKLVHKHYDDSEEIGGYSLQGISIKHGGAPGNLRAPDQDNCFIYPILGTWGFSPHRKRWFEFIEWYKKAAKKPNFQPLVPGTLPSAWYQTFIKQGKTDGMWSMWHIYYNWNHKLWTLYPNLPHSQGLTISWRDSGLHYEKGSNERPDQLLQEWNKEYESFPHYPTRLDINGKILNFRL